MCRRNFKAGYIKRFSRQFSAYIGLFSIIRVVVIRILIYELVSKLETEILLQYPLNIYLTNWIRIIRGQGMTVKLNIIY